MSVRDNKRIGDVASDGQSFFLSSIHSVVVKNVIYLVGQPMFQLELGHVVLWLPCFVQVGVALLFTATP